MDYISHYTSPLGDMTMASDGEALCGLWFDGGRYFGDVIVPPYEEKELSIFDETKHWLDVYFGGSCPDFTPQLAMSAAALWMQISELFAFCFRDGSDNQTRDRTTGERKRYGGDSAGIC